MYEKYWISFKKGYYLESSILYLYFGYVHIVLIFFFFLNDGMLQSVSPDLLNIRLLVLKMLVRVFFFSQSHTEH